MNEIISVIPEKYRAYVLALILLAPYLTRAYHAIAIGGGLKGIWNSIWFGTNVPPSLASDIKNIGTAVNAINQTGPNPNAVLTVNNTGNK